MSFIPKKKIDKFQNVHNKFGTSLTKFGQTEFAAGKLLGRSELNNLYRYSWLVRKFCSTLPQDALKNWINIKIDDKDKLLKINSIIQKHKLKSKLIQVNTWARLYGGAVLFLGIKDGKNLEEPVDFNNIKSLDFINIFDRYQIDIEKIYTDPTQPKYFEPELYRINPVFSSEFGILVHESRILKFDGIILPDDLRESNNRWGDSIIISAFEDIKRFDVGQTSASEIIEDFVIKIHKMFDLKDLLTNNKEDILYTRMAYASKRMALDGVTVISPDDDFQKIGTPINGLIDILNNNSSTVGAAGDYPKTKLFGEQTGTLAGAEETTRDYYSKGELFQETQVDPMDYILKIMMSLPEINISENDWEWEFNNIYTRSEKEIAEERKLIAETDAIYLANGVIMPEEIRDSRFAGDYSPETVLNPEFDDLEDDLEEAEEEESKRKFNETLDSVETEDLLLEASHKEDASRPKQTIIISKKIASSASEARKIASKYLSKGEKFIKSVDVTENFYRFRVRHPGAFKEGTFRFFSPKSGVKILFGTLK